MQQSRNPWVTSPVSAEDPAQTTDIQMPPAAVISTPLVGMVEPDSADRLGSRTMKGSASMWIVGAHGGAGESRIADIIDGARITDHCWPVLPGSTNPRVLLVCRADMRGLTAARSALTQWASGAAPEVDLLGLAVLADAPGKKPKELREFASIVGGGAPRLWTLSWVESWRLGHSAAVPTARDYHRFITDLVTLATDNPSSTTK